MREKVNRECRKKMDPIENLRARVETKIRDEEEK